MSLALELHRSRLCGCPETSLTHSSAFGIQRNAVTLNLINNPTVCFWHSKKCSNAGFDNWKLTCSIIWCHYIKIAVLWQKVFSRLQSSSCLMLLTCCWWASIDVLKFLSTTVPPQAPPVAWWSSRFRTPQLCAQWCHQCYLQPKKYEDICLNIKII